MIILIAFIFIMLYKGLKESHQIKKDIKYYHKIHPQK
jgi:hypothetical protein